MIFAALDTIKGFRQARISNDIPTMAKLYRQNVIDFPAKNGNIGGQIAFYNNHGLTGLISHPRAYLNNKMHCPYEILRFAIPQLIDNDRGLHKLEIIQEYWTRETAIKHAKEGLFREVAGLENALETDLEKAAILFERMVMNYKSQRKSQNGQMAFYIEQCQLAGLFGRKHDFLDNKISPHELLKITLPNLYEHLKAKGKLN